MHEITKLVRTIFDFPTYLPIANHSFGLAETDPTIEAT